MKIGVDGKHYTSAIKSNHLIGCTYIKTLKNYL